MKAQKEALLQMRDRILPNMQGVTRDHLRSGESNVSSASGQHIGDAGSEAEVRDLTIRLLDKDREQLFEIDEALERIRRGVYGICEVSLEIIPKKRLQARPYCRLTVKCQEEYEKKYGSYANFREHNQDAIGYANLQNDMENVISLDEDQ
ncbi:MAG: TraR/DksA family transcriptional regulator [Akkermansia sp.]|nr:TraR/DksA family transcriptional regulator [Akkermansia sp.]